MSASDIAVMHISSTGQSMDAIIEVGKNREDLDLEAVRRYMRKANNAGRRAFQTHDDPWQVLKKLELVRSEEQITRAAILLFGKNPQSPLSQAVIQAGRVRQKTYIMDSRVMEGSICDQIDETMEFIKKNIHVRFEITGAPQRTDVWDYPLIAVREAVTNAVCHRDYGDVGHIQVKISEESLQIWNPGPLPFDFSLQELVNPDHASRPRNKAIAQILFDMGYIERYGGGIQRMFDQCQAAGLKPPTFEQAQGGLKVRFSKRTDELPGQAANN